MQFLLVIVGLKIYSVYNDGNTAGAGTVVMQHQIM